MKYQINHAGGVPHSYTVEVKAESPEQAAIKGVAKHYHGFKPKTIVESNPITKTSWAITVADKSGATRKVYVGEKTDEINEGVDR